MASLTFKPHPISCSLFAYFDLLIYLCPAYFQQAVQEVHNENMVAMRPEIINPRQNPGTERGSIGRIGVTHVAEKIYPS